MICNKLRFDIAISIFVNHCIDLNNKMNAEMSEKKISK